jgi:hypothetical protein
MTGKNPFTRKRNGRAEDGVERARARWGLVFYCWRNLLVLSAATAMTVDTILAILQGRSPHALNELTSLLK